MAKVNFTTGRLSDHKCPIGQSQSFLWDSTTQGLGLRVTPKGKPTFVYQGVYQGKDIRLVIGKVDTWTIPLARERARVIKITIDEGRDPRELKAENIANDSAKRAATKREKVTFGEAWVAYLAERKPAWGERHYIDHVKLSQVGGVPCKGPKGSKTIAGPLAYFLPLPIKSITHLLVQEWATKEAITRPARARLSLRLLKAFLTWCESEIAYQGVTDSSAARGKKIKEVVGASGVKSDCLQRQQLPAWFKHVRQIQNPVIAAYLQGLLITGARREELAGLRWDDVNFQWHGMTLKDKIEGQRSIPLTPYVSYLIQSLPRRNEYVFSSPTSASGRLVGPTIAHNQACAAAGLELSLHGLRRSFATLGEWLDIPGGIGGQIQGHKPQSVREKNYIRRPIDLLRVQHEKIEAWMLEQGQVSFDASAVNGRLAVVAK
jgi:integrase